MSVKKPIGKYANNNVLRLNVTQIVVLHCNSNRK